MKRMRGWLVATALLAVAATAQGSMLDATITIDRALNSPTLTVRYSGASATLAELRLNGESVATRALNGKLNKGETTFSIDLSTLRDGDNSLEVRLFDAAGHLVGTEKDIVSTDNGAQAPVYFDNPKSGAMLEGPVEIKLGLGQAFKSGNVSFFIDNRFVSMTNTPPYSFTWDTAREKNGWHELESWLVDDSSTTYKTRRIRVFVNNPSGQTNRHYLSIRKAPTGNPVAPQTTGTSAGLKPAAQTTAPVPSAPTPAAQAAAATQVTPLVLTEVLNAVDVHLAGAPATIKELKHAKGVATGPKFLTPTGSRNAAESKASAAKAVAAAVKPATIKSTGAPAANLGGRKIAILKGSRLAGLKTFSVLLNDEYVNFDVQPRIEEGVPMTPIRYLLEKDGGKVEWDNANKTVSATAEGHNLQLQIGHEFAHVDKLPVRMERAPYLISSRTIVPLSFIHDALGLDVEFDKSTGHVLISSQAKAN
jgi:hypothetical protein